MTGYPIDKLFGKALFATIAAVGFGMPMAAVSATNITGHVVLAADADWRGLGPVALAEGATLNLNEHSLKCDALAVQSLDPGEDVTSSDGVVTTATTLSGGSVTVCSTTTSLIQQVTGFSHIKEGSTSHTTSGRATRNVSAPTRFTLPGIPPAHRKAGRSRGLTATTIGQCLTPAPTRLVGKILVRARIPSTTRLPIDTISLRCRRPTVASIWS